MASRNWAPTPLSAVPRSTAALLGPSCEPVLPLRLPGETPVWMGLGERLRNFNRKLTRTCRPQTSGLRRAHKELDARELMISKLQVCLVQGRALQVEIESLNRQACELAQRTRSSLSGPPSAFVAMTPLSSVSRSTAALLGPSCEPVLPLRLPGKTPVWMGLGERLRKLTRSCRPQTSGLGRAHKELDARELMISKLQVCLVQGRALQVEIESALSWRPLLSLLSLRRPASVNRQSLSRLL